MLFNTMPRITNPKGIAMINRGFINSLLFQALDSLWILEEGGGSEPGIRSLSNRSRSPCHRCVCGPVFYLLRAITALENAITFRLNVTTPGRDCCLIVDSFEKNYREKKTRQGDKGTGTEGDGETRRQGRPEEKETGEAAKRSNLT